jgi:hypothetical protein
MLPDSRNKFIFPVLSLQGRKGLVFAISFFCVSLGKAECNGRTFSFLG